MHIKQVVLAGFKSYRDKTVVDNIDPGLNIVVGKNGTGKSNIFNAIRFVLDDGEIENLRNSVGSQRGQESFVELLFDNSDSRFLTFGEEVAIKRSLDSPADFWINGKKTPKNDVLNHLESAGFGRYNPFYVVPQGKVASLINSTEEERLQLLLTASGLDLFERKKKEAQKSINKSLKDIDNIEGTLSEINDRLQSLEEEISVSEEFQSAELEQRQLKFQQLKREQAMVSNVLEECTIKLKQLRQIELEAESNLVTAQESQQEKESNISQLKYAIDTLSTQLDFANTAQDSEQLPAENPQAFDELIASAETEINSNLTEMASLKNKLAENLSQSNEISTQLRGLQIKLSQSSKFNSQQERDEWLKEQISKAGNDLKAQTALEKSFRDQVEAMDVPMVPTGAIDDLSAQLEESKNIVHQEQEKLVEAQSSLKTVQLERRKNLILAESIDEQIQSVVKNTSDSILVDVVAAIDQAKKCAHDLGVADKFYGPIANLMKLEETYTPATEAIAKSSLFYCVVEDAETARVLAKEMVDRKSGRISFIPLQQVNTRPTVELEEADQEEAAVLIDLIECEEKFRPAVSVVIGSALLCADLEASWRCSRAYNVDCVTIEGSLVSPHGALRGGSRKSQATSRFAALASLSEIYDHKTAVSARSSELDAELDQVQQRVTNAHNVVSQAKRQVTTVFSQLEEARREYSRASLELESAIKARDYKVNQLERVTAEIESLNQLKKGYEGKLDTEFSAPLDADENEQLETLARESDKLQSARTSLERRLARAQRALEESKSKKWDAELSRERSLAESQFESENIETTAEDIALLESRRAETVQEQSDARIALQNIVSEVTEAAARLFKTQKEIKKQEYREEKYHDLLKDSTRQTRQLGLSEARELDELTDAQIEERSQEVQSKLNRCGPINQFAQEQYSKYKHEYSAESGNRNKVVEELQQSQQMIVQLDGYKSKAILKTFKEVETRFSTFFKRLTRTDTAKLHVEGSNPLEWKGLEITVSFARHRQLRIEQLSGGQKALCALAFLLSLQASDPAPFYIFDEVDASLDAQYRGSLADTLKQISSKLDAQFICTTFSPELVQKADQIYGTAFANNTSTAGVIDRDLALSLVDVSNQDVARVLG